MIIREACVGNFIEAKNAENLGAERIELCENLYDGGTTPSYGTVKKVLEKIKIPTTEFHEKNPRQFSLNK